ncbi:MAG: hypothetical protein R3D43_11855 [Tepidamorphaceae bacterium]
MQTFSGRLGDTIFQQQGFPFPQQGPAPDLMTRPDTSETQTPGRKSRKVRFGKYEIALPASRVARILLGVGLIIGGLLGFLPVLGFWMVPLGVIVLSVDFAIMRYLRQKGEKLVRNGVSRINGKKERT